MTTPDIRNIILDIGNVIVPWDPVGIVTSCFGAEAATPEFVRAVFGPDIWHPLNRGEISGAEARERYQAKLGIDAAKTDALFDTVKESMWLIPETAALMQRLSAAGYRMYGLSDNVHELVSYLKERHDFWRYFEGAIISAEVGLLKPDPAIYRCLLDTYGLQADQCVFFDDMPYNVAGAKAVGLHAFLFTDAATAAADLRSLGVVIPG